MCFIRNWSTFDSGFFIQEENEMTTKMKGQELQTADAELPMLKPDDMQYFDKLLIDVDENALSPEEVKERRIMKLLLKVDSLFILNHLNYIHLVSDDE